MRKYFLILFLSLMCSAQLFSQNSYLQVSLFDDEPFSIMLDNTQLTEGTYAEFDMLSPGEHSLKVIKSGVDQSAQGNVIFEGKIKIPSGSDLYAVIDEYNAFTVYKKKKYGYNRIFPTGDNVRKCGDNGNVKKDKEEYSSNDECRYKVMKKEDFDDLKKSIGSRNFESSNISVVKTAIDNNFFTAEQIKELLRFFTFDDSKLEVAKYSYKKVCDQKNFFKVYDAFDFDSSVNELKNYISGK